MRGFVSRLAAFLRIIFLPVVVLGAFAMISYGLAVWFGNPVGWISGGVFLLIAVIDARR
jgi:hypothetical protein